MHYKPVLIVVIIFVFCPIQILSVLSSASTEKNIILEPIAYECICNVGEVKTNYLVVRYEQGLKWVSYIAFNLSDIPIGAEIKTVKLKLKTCVVEKSSWISVFNTTDVKWISTGISWDNRPNLDKLLATQWVTTFEEWYEWEHEYLTRAVKSAFSNEGVIGLALQSYLLTDVSGGFFSIPKQNWRSLMSLTPILLLLLKLRSTLVPLHRMMT